MIDMLTFKSIINKAISAFNVVVNKLYVLLKVKW